MDINEFIKAQRKANAELATTGKKLLNEHLQKFMDENPGIIGLRWEEYTPYFNDGDACIFRVGELRFRPAHGSEEAGEQEDGYLAYYDEEAKPLVNELTAVKELGQLLNTPEIESICEAAFGDHTRVTITRDGDKLLVEAEPYEHD